MSKRLAVLAAAVLAVAAVAFVSSAAGALQVGIYDDGQILGKPERTFPTLKRLRVQVVRVTMWWGGPGGVATRRPETATDPDDPAYSWGVYDRTVRLAAENGIKVLFSIVATPRWANGGQPPNRAPKKASDLRNFAYAAAKRYSGSFVPGGAEEEDALPAVKLWLAWNEPNNPVFLSPQFKRAGTRVVAVNGRRKRVARYSAQSPVAYAKICNAVVNGVKATLTRGEKVACGATAPRGNNVGRGFRPSISPIAFLNAMKRAGAKGFYAYAHHPYYGKPTETPGKAPSSKTAITLGNIGVLIKRVTQLYGRKPIWLTEYGYQTKPPDPFFGVSWARQASYLTQAYRIARRNPRIQMMIWFLLRDERRARGRDGWQSGLLTYGGKQKPAYRAFQRLRR